MNLDQRKLSIGLVLIYIICVIITSYTLLTLQDNLIYQAQALTISELDNAEPVFLKLFLTVGITMIFSIGIVLYLLSNKGMEIIYVEKKEKKEEKVNDEDSTTENKTFDLKSVNEIVSSKVKSDEKILTDSLTEVCKAMEAGVGAFYMLKKDGDKNVLQMNATYAMSLAESQRPTFELGEGLVGQVGLEKQALIIDDIPENYIKVISGLGSASPTHVLVSPVMYGEKLWGVVEIASFTTFSKQHIAAIDQAFKVVTKKILAKKVEVEKANKTDVKETSETTKNKNKKE